MGKCIREDESPSKHKGGCNPVGEGEWVLKVEDRDEQTDKLPQRNNKCDD